MTLYQKLLIACLYVLGFDDPVDISFEHGGHNYNIYNYVEQWSDGLEIGVDFTVDETEEDFLFDDLWWSIRKRDLKGNNKTNYSRLNEAIESVISSIH